MAPSANISDFKVRRCAAELVAPAKPTAFQVLKLSDLDHEPSLRSMLPNLHCYNYNPSMENADPVKVLKEALARTLVFYYPLAGRLRESPEDNRKLVVECTGEGATFVEADADFTIKELGIPLHPPFPYLDEFVPSLPGPEFDPDIFNCTLVYVQVTRMKCGGFVVGTRISNNLVDGTGCCQFLRAFSEMAQGFAAPSLLPVWQRELLCARDPPKVTFVHHELDEHPELVRLPNMAFRLLFFTDKEVAALRKLAPDHLQKCSTFDLITTCLWRTRAIALQLKPEENAPLGFAMNARQKYDPPLPKGYYGNAIAFLGLVSNAKDLYENPFGYALEKVVNAKSIVTDEYMRSFIDDFVQRGYPKIGSELTSFFVADLRRLGFHDVDFGWGEPEYGGPGYAWYDLFPHLDTTYIRCKNGEGEDWALSAICLQAPNMEIFLEELYKLIGTKGIDPFEEKIPSSSN